MSGLTGESRSEGGEGQVIIHRVSPTAPSMALSPQTHTITYQVILRHLAKFRDGALAILRLVDSQRTGASDGRAATPAGHGTEHSSASESPDSNRPLPLRIDEHMTTVDRALAEIRELNPDQRQTAELSAEVRQRLIIKERTIHDIVGAELHFWSAAIENSPPDSLDPTERAWVGRMIRMANILGVDDEHKQHFEFLEDWASGHDR